MDGFIKSFSPILKRLRIYTIEIILITIALVIMISSVVIYLKSVQDNPSDEEILGVSSEDVTTKIFVDISGAVKKPNLYRVDFGARLRDVLDSAGGLSEEADTEFFQRNFNLARVVTDQEKIYVPSITEIMNGVFIQNQRTLDYSSTGITPSTGIARPPTGEAGNNPIDNLININNATIEELDQLPGVGQVTATKIISNRPYNAIDELNSKKVINKGVFEKIKSLITTN